MKFLFIPMALLAGLIFPVQAGINSRLGSVIGGPVAAAFASFAVGTMGLLCWIFVSRAPLNLSAGFHQTALWQWVGGLIGAYIVVAMTFLAPRMGAGTLIALLLTGQLLGSLLLDQFGLFGYPVIPIDAKRLLGVALLGAGVYFIKQ